MKKKTHKAILNHYTDLYKKFGDHPGSLGWPKGKQEIRFQTMSEIGNLNNSSILDVGCGFGDFYGFLKYKKINAKYLGIDILPEFIEIGKKIYPRAQLQVRDFQSKKFKQRFDWVFFSGISVGVNYKIIQKIMNEMFKICKNGIALNFVGGILDYKSKDIFYSKPEKIYSLSTTLSHRVSLRHDYMPFEFTIYIYKDNSKTDNLVFKNYLKTSNMSLNDYNWRPSHKLKIKK